MKLLKSLFAVMLIAFISCQNEKKETPVSEKTTEITVEKENYQKQIDAFLKENETITKQSYDNLYELILKDYRANRDNDKYRIIIHIAKKASKENNIDLKNQMYQNLKEEFLK